MSALVRSALLSSLEAKIVTAPRDASIKATCRPIPDVPPVMMQVVCLRSHDSGATAMSTSSLVLDEFNWNSLLVISIVSLSSCN